MPRSAGPFAESLPFPVMMGSVPRNGVGRRAEKGDPDSPPGREQGRTRMVARRELHRRPPARPEWVLDAVAAGEGGLQACEKIGRTSSRHVRAPS